MKTPMKQKLQFIKSAVLPKDYPPPNRPELVVAGRSNAGKSSFLNALGSEPIAKVSQTPGKTRLLNFFEVGDKYRIVDTPGYGFSKRSGDEQAGWQEILENYFSLRQNLCGVLLLMDLRRDWEEDERLLHSYAFDMNIPIAVLLTKIDKVKTHEQLKHQQRIRKQSHIDDVFLISAPMDHGIEEVEDFAFRRWILPFMQEMKKK